MARRPLKVFRTSAGFEDVYVAAPSRKAALAAWGTDKDLFARGAAEVVTDPELVKQALSRPGEVIRLSRATRAQHLSAVGRPLQGAVRRKRAKEAPGPAREMPAPEALPAKPKLPKPSRQKVEAAETAIEKHEAALAQALHDIDNAIEQLREKRNQAKLTAEAEAAKLQAILGREERSYRVALDRWME